MRMVRQHKILKAMPDAVLSSASIFSPLNIPNFYKTITEGHIVSNLSLSDVKALWDLYSIRKDFSIQSFYVDSEYLVNPPMSEYGGAWVLIPKGNDFAALHSTISQKSQLTETQINTDTSIHSQNDKAQKGLGQ